MGKKKFVQPEYPPGWQVADKFSWNNRHIEVGTELTVRGIRGRVRFVKHVTVLEEINEQWSEVKAEWIDAIDRDKHFRSFAPERIRTVHRLNKTRENHAKA